MAELDDYSKGDRLSAKRLNAHQHETNRLTSAIEAGIKWTRDVEGQPVLVKGTLGVIVLLGPAGQADHPDERYWVQEAFIKAADDDAQPLDLLQSEALKAPSGADVPVIHTVSNLVEQPEHSHTLKPGTPVLFWEEEDLPREVSADEPIPVPNMRKVMQVGGSLPRIQYKEMVVKAVTDNQVGADFVRAHGTIENPF